MAEVDLHVITPDGALVDASLPHRLVADQHIAVVEEEDAHPLDREVCHVGEIVAIGVDPGVERDGRAGQPKAVSRAGA